jgi:tetratricopeptide (TPR) repeat protein
VRNHTKTWRTAALGIAAAVLAACGTVPAQTGDSGRTAAGNYLSANLAANESNLNAAADFYADALREDPNNTDLLTRAFLYAATVGDTEKAIGLAHRLIAQQPDNRAALLVLAIDEMGKGDYDAVLNNLKKSGQGPFTSLTDNILEAWALEGQGKADAALKTLAGLESQSGAQGLYAFHKALLLDHQGHTKEAAAAYKDALSIMGTSPRLIDAYGRFLEILGENAAAKELYAKLLKANPGHPVAVSALARIAAGGKPKPLVETPVQGAAEGLFGIASSLNEERSADVAMLYLNLALYLRPDFDLARVLLADHYETQGKFETAITLYGKIAPDSPYYNIVQVQRQIDDARLGHTDKAIAELKKMAQQRPDNVDVWTAVGDLQRTAEKYSEAASSYDKAIAAADKAGEPRWGLYYARGMSEERSKNWPAAERDLREALKLSPDQPDVLNYLGYSWVDQGANLTEAVSLLEKARSLRPTDGYIVDSVGWAYYRLERYKDAATALEQAVQLAPSDATINDHLGDAYWKAGRRDDARFQWQHALNLDPSAERKPIIERKIELGLDAVAAGTN